MQGPGNSFNALKTNPVSSTITAFFTILNAEIAFSLAISSAVPYKSGTIFF